MSLCQLLCPQLVPTTDPLRYRIIQSYIAFKSCEENPDTNIFVTDGRESDLITRVYLIVSTTRTSPRCIEHNRRIVYPHISLSTFPHQISIWMGGSRILQCTCRKHDHLGYPECSSLFKLDYMCSSRFTIGFMVFQVYSR